jgi:hypothetical protein
VSLNIAKRALQCINRVVPEDEIVFVWSGRAENELGIGQRFEFALLDGSQAARSRVAVRPGVDKTPDAMATQRRCVPLGARQGGRERGSMYTRCYQGGRALERRHFFRGLVDTYAHARFEFGRQPDPVRMPAGS